MIIKIYSKIFINFRSALKFYYYINKFNNLKFFLLFYNIIFFILPIKITKYIKLNMFFFIILKKLYIINLFIINNLYNFNVKFNHV